MRCRDWLEGHSVLFLVMFGRSGESLLENKAAQRTAGQQTEEGPKTICPVDLRVHAFNSGGWGGVNQVVLLHTYLT